MGHGHVRTPDLPICSETALYAGCRGQPGEGSQRRCGWNRPVNARRSAKGEESGEELHVTAEDLRELIATLNHYCLHAGTERFKKEQGVDSLPEDFFATTPPEVLREFFRCINWSYKEAQLIIVHHRLRLEAARRANNLEIEVPYSFKFMIGLLTDYADTIGWAMLQGDLSWVRAQFLDVRGHSDLAHHNWESVETILTDFNKDPDQIMLATDLTSFLQVGDVFLRNTATGQTTRFEIKAGHENERVLKVLSATSTKEFEQRMAQYVGSSKDRQHAMKQLERNLKQHLRMAGSSKYIDSGRTERVDLKTDQPVIVHETDILEESWSGVVRELAQGLGEVDAATGTIDGCLFFEYGTGPHTVSRDLYFRYRVSKQLGLGLEEAALRRLLVLDVAQATAMPGFVPQSTNLLQLGEDRQSRLLALDDYLVVYLHVPGLSSLAAASGASLKIRNMRSADEPYRDPLIRNLFGNNKVACITFEQQIHGEFNLAGGLVGRVLLNFLAPRSIFRMASDAKPEAPDSR